IVEANGKKIYHAGDTDFIEEMKDIDADLALLPIGGTYTMDVEEAISAANAINASFFAPMHYKALLGKENSAKAEKEFKERVENSFVMNEEWEPFFSF
ncbi:MAG: MBL fold metallo-hydrolase, partial [Candidatus Micrarchaeaceae archaeon]